MRVVFAALRKLCPLSVLLISAFAIQSAIAQSKAPFSDLSSYVKWVQAHHRAPFDRDGAVLPPGGAKALQKAQANTGIPALIETTLYHNYKVNQDRNPWPKAEIAAAIDPANGHNYVVMSNDFRENYDRQFFHVSTDGGATWTDDSMVGGAIAATGFIPGAFQSDPGVAFDRASHSYLSTITGNLIYDYGNGYFNFDTQIELAQGFAGGTYASLLSTSIDDQPCNGTAAASSCVAILDKPLITTDTSGTASDGTTYVYYTLFCNGVYDPTTGNYGPCTDGSATVPAFSSAILESHSAGAGLPFSPPALVSGQFTQEQFSDMVIDSYGTAHIFFDDFTDSLFVNMYESTLVGTHWVVNSTPIAKFAYNGLANINWGFRDNGAVAPGCGIHGNTAYCAFSANQLAGGKAEGTPSVYLAVVNARNGASTVHRVNNDAFGNGKHHFFAWATATPGGAVYVGWYDDRKDPFNTKVHYFVGKSTDGGKTFATQKAVSDVASNPCVGFPGCGFFGDYVQLVSGPDGTVHAAWSDTRDGASMQIWSQPITW